MSAPRQHTYFPLSSFFAGFSLLRTLIVQNSTGKLFLIVIVLNGARLRKGDFIFYPFDHVHLQPLSPAFWTSLVRVGITRVKPTRRGSRGAGKSGRLNRRAKTTLVSNSSSGQPPVQMGYSGFLEQNENKVTGNLHSEVSELNIHSDTSFRTTKCIVVERSPLLPTQKDR